MLLLEAIGQQRLSRDVCEVLSGAWRIRRGVQGLEVSADLVDQVNAIAEQEEAKAEQMKNTVDFALYGGLVRPSPSLYMSARIRKSLPQVPCSRSHTSACSSQPPWL
jgi:hypothetical protein